MKAVDAFCGAGGASRGLHDAGFDVVGFDNWQPAVDTHNANGLKAHLHDLSDPTLDNTIPDCDLMWLSCPCQPFSAAGDGEGEFDDRDGFPWGLRLVARKLPAVVIFENVKGLTFAKHHAYFAGILESLRALGYQVGWCVLNCADYGVPQTRERCFIVCRRDGGPITWPMPTHTEPAGMFTQRWVTMADALGWGDTAAIEYSRGAGLIERHGERRPHPFTEPAPAITANAEKDYKVILNTGLSWVKGGTREDAHKLNATTSPAPSVTTKSGSQWHLSHEYGGTTESPQNSIHLTIPELAALQDFPTDWIWTGTKTAQARQVGNAVPPIMALLLAEANRPLDQRAVA